MKQLGTIEYTADHKIYKGVCFEVQSRLPLNDNRGNFVTTRYVKYGKESKPYYSCYDNARLPYLLENPVVVLGKMVEEQKKSGAKIYGVILASTLLVLGVLAVRGCAKTHKDNKVSQSVVVQDMRDVKTSVLGAVNFKTR